MLEGYFEHYTEVPFDQWIWPNFLPGEVASNGDESIIIHRDTLNKAQLLRDNVGRMIINSWYRDKVYNKVVGGSANSWHVKGQALDISLNGHDKYELFRVARAVGFTGFGFYDTFLHVDTGNPRWWDNSASGWGKTLMLG